MQLYGTVLCDPLSETLALSSTTNDGRLQASMPVRRSDLGVSGYYFAGTVILVKLPRLTTSGVANILLIVFVKSLVQNVNMVKPITVTTVVIQLRANYIITEKMLRRCNDCCDLWV